MFGDDFFGGGIDDLFRKLSGQNGFVESTVTGADGKKRTTRRMQRDVFGQALLDKILTKKRLYFVFDFSGKSDVHAAVKDELVTNDYDEEVATGKKVLEIKEGDDLIAEYPLSDNMKINQFESSFCNGILEVSFRK